MSPENDVPSPDNEAPQTRRQGRNILIGAGLAFTVVLAAGAWVRISQAGDLKTWTGEAQVPTVALVSPASSRKGQDLVLPGALAAYYDAPLYARVPGYLKSWSRDIGAHVKKGELLAVIDTPELDQQIAQARADLSAAQAAQKVSGTTAARWDSLLPLDAVSRQDVEEKDADLAGKTGKVQAAKAELDRLQAMKAFARIVAPFDGVVTKRTADIGALVTGSPASNGEPLFAVADTHALRLYVNVPQSYAAQIVPGLAASLTVPEYPGRSFPARLVSNAGAISTTSSTLLVEFEASNPNGLLKPGDYAQVDMTLPGGSAGLHLPASALLFRAEGLEVATLGPDSRVVMKPITIATDMGTQVIVGSGLSADDKVINNPPDSLAQGDKVRVGHDAG